MVPRKEGPASLRYGEPFYPVRVPHSVLIWLHPSFTSPFFFSLTGNNSLAHFASLFTHPFIYPLLPLFPKHRHYFYLLWGGRHPIITSSEKKRTRVTTALRAALNDDEAARLGEDICPLG